MIPLPIALCTIKTPTMKIEKLAVFGSRTIDDARVDQAIREAIKTHKPKYIVTAQEPLGVCQRAQEMAREMGLPAILHYKNPRYLTGMFERRSKAVLSDCDLCLFVHDGNSQGTINEMKIADKLGTPKKYVLIPVIEAKGGFTWDDLNFDL